MITDDDIFSNTFELQEFSKLVTNEIFIVVPLVCPHEDTITIDHVINCKVCGQEIENLSFEPEWRFYGSADTRNCSNPSRCHKGKNQNKTVGILLDHLQLSTAIKALTQKKYQNVVGKETVRGKGRKAIVAACLFHAFKDFGECRTQNEIRDWFGIKIQRMSTGMTAYYKVFPTDITCHIEPRDLVKNILFKIEANIRAHYRKILSLVKLVENKSLILNRSNPYSVAASIVFLYLCIHPQYKQQLELTKKSFAKKVKLSDITISKLAKEACFVIKAGVRII